MKRFKNICIMLCVALLCTFSACDSANDNDSYNEYYDEYDKGYENGWDDLHDVMYDELEWAEYEKSELVRLMFESVYDGDKIRDGISWRAGNFTLRFHLEDEDCLYFDIKIRGFNLKNICTTSDNYVDNLPVTCYVGRYDEFGDFVVYRELFAGEKIFYNNFEFTSDGYLTDYYKLDHNSDTLYILLFVDGEVYAATYKVK